MNTIIHKTIAISFAASALLAASQDLGTITVTSASKSQQSIESITSPITVITAYELEEKQISSLTQALNLASGISFTQNGSLGSSTALSVRGSDNNRILVLIDGVKYKDHSSIGGTDIAHLMIDDVERIEIIKGAQSGVWGADASAGIVNIITKDPKEGTSGSLRVEAGSFSTKKYAAMFGYKDSRFDVQVNAQKIDTDGFTSQAPKGDDIDRYEDDGYDNTTWNVKSNFYFNDDASLSFNVFGVDALKEYDVSGADDTAMENDVQTRSYALGYDQNIQNHQLKLKLERTDIKRDQIGTSWGVKLTDNRTSNLELSDTLSYNDEDFIVAGLGSLKDELEYTKADATKADAHSNAEFVFLTNNNAFDQWIVTESLRYDDYDNFDSKVTGKAGVKYTLNAQSKVFANIGTAYSVPLLIKNINPWGASNMDIKPEESVSYDVGFKYRDVRVTYFYQKVKDLIDWYDPTPTDYTNNDAIYKNLNGKNIFKGFEIEYAKAIVKDTLFSLSYTSLSAKDKDKKDLARRPKSTLKFGLDYYGLAKTHIGLYGEYIGERKEYDWDGSLKAQTGKYTLINLTADYEVDARIKIYAKIDNLSDKEYQTIDGYAASPRAYYAGVKYSF
jgi:vitamin B12 transporter